MIDHVTGTPSIATRHIEPFNGDLRVFAIVAKAAGKPPIKKTDKEYEDLMLERVDEFVTGTRVNMQTASDPSDVQGVASEAQLVGMDSDTMITMLSAVSQSVNRPASSEHGTTPGSTTSAGPCSGCQ